MGEERWWGSSAACGASAGRGDRARVLIVGATGHMGKQLAMASLREGHPTFLLLRPDAALDVHKAQLFLSLKRAGAKFFKGSMEDLGTLVAIIKQVDVVVSAVGEDGLLQQLALIEAMKKSGNVKRFLPSEFGMDPDKLIGLPSPTGDLFACKREIRRAIEEANIPFTYISANCLAGWFLGGLAQIGQFMPPTDDVLIYGDGNQKVIWVKEEDVATYAIKTIEDVRAINKTVYIRPPLNILSQNEVVALWEKIQEKPLKKTYVDEEAWLSEIKDSSWKSAVRGHFHLVFFQGKTYNIDIQPESSEEASSLYPEFKYETAQEYLLNFV